MNNTLNLEVDGSTPAETASGFTPVDQEHKPEAGPMNRGFLLRLQMGESESLHEQNDYGSNVSRAPAANLWNMLSVTKSIIAWVPCCQYRAFLYGRNLPSSNGFFHRDNPPCKKGKYSQDVFINMAMSHQHPPSPDPNPTANIWDEVEQ